MWQPRGTGGSAPQPGDIVMYKNDLARTGQYPLETKLTPANVSSANFGLDANNEGPGGLNNGVFNENALQGHSQSGAYAGIQHSF